MKRKWWIIIPLGLLIGSIGLYAGFYYIVTVQEYTLNDEIIGPLSYRSQVESFFDIPSETFGISDFNLQEWHPDNYQTTFSDLQKGQRQVRISYTLNYSFNQQVNFTYNGGGIFSNGTYIGFEVYPSHIWINNSHPSVQDTQINIDSHLNKNFSEVLILKLSVDYYTTNLFNAFGENHLYQIIAILDASINDSNPNTMLMFYTDSQYFLI